MLLVLLTRLGIGIQKFIVSFKIAFVSSLFIEKLFPRYQCNQCYKSAASHTTDVAAKHILLFSNSG